MPEDFAGALFAYPWPFHRDGIDAALDRVERSGCREVVVTTTTPTDDRREPTACVSHRVARPPLIGKEVYAEKR